MWVLCQRNYTTCDSWYKVAKFSEPSLTWIEMVLACEWYVKFILTLSWRRPLSYRNQSIDLVCKSMGWFLYDNGLRHERVKPVFNSVLWLFCLSGNLFDFLFLVDLFRNIFIIFYCWNITLISHERMKDSYLFLIQKQSSGGVLWGCS